MIFQEPMTSLNPVLRVGVQMNEVLAEHDGISEEEATKKSIKMLDAVGIPEPERRINDYLSSSIFRRNEAKNNDSNGTSVQSILANC